MRRARRTKVENAWKHQMTTSFFARQTGVSRSRDLQLHATRYHPHGCTCPLRCLAYSCRRWGRVRMLVATAGCTVSVPRATAHASEPAECTVVVG
eukprot:4988680-Prymnesium_polylepis.1